MSLIFAQGVQAASHEDLERLVESLNSRETLILACFSMAFALLGGLTALWTDRRSDEKSMRQVVGEMLMSGFAGLGGTAVLAGFFSNGLYFIAANYVLGYSGVFLVQTAVRYVKNRAEKLTKTEPDTCKPSDREESP